MFQPKQAVDEKWLRDTFHSWLPSLFLSLLSQIVVLDPSKGSPQPQLLVKRCCLAEWASLRCQDGDNPGRDEALDLCSFLWSIPSEMWISKEQPPSLLCQCPSPQVGHEEFLCTWGALMETWSHPELLFFTWALPGLLVNSPNLLLASILYWGFPWDTDKLQAFF